MKVGKKENFETLIDISIHGTGLKKQFTELKNVEFGQVMVINKFH